MENTRRLLATALIGMAYRDDAVGTANGTGTAVAAPTVPDGMRLETFHFRKEKIKDEAGNEIEVFKHPSVQIPMPVPTKEEVLAIFNDPARTSEQKFILDQIEDAFYLQARDQINEFREANSKGTVTADIIDYSKLTINALANMPAGERGSKVSDEDIEEFLKDYVAVMPQAAGKDASKIKAQANIMQKGLRTVKTDKRVLGAMDEMLTIWAASSENVDEHTPVYDMLKGRIKKWISAEPKNVLESIL